MPLDGKKGIKKSKQKAGELREIIVSYVGGRGS